MDIPFFGRVELEGPLLGVVLTLALIGLLVIVRKIL